MQKPMAEPGSFICPCGKRSKETGGRLTRDEQRLPKVSRYAKLKEELWVYLLPPVASDSSQLEIPLQ